MEIKCYVGNCTQLDTAVQFLNSIAADFPIPLDQKTDIRKLVEKVYQYGYIIFAEAEHDIVGINMIYANDQVDRCAWITVLGVDKEYGMNNALIMGILVSACIVVNDVLRIISVGLTGVTFQIVLVCLATGIAAFAGTFLGIRLLRAVQKNMGFSIFAFYCWGLALFMFLLNLVA